MKTPDMTAPKTITVETTGGVVERLRCLVETGLYGATVEQAAHELLCEQLRRKHLWPAAPETGEW